jgi:glycosyltransferase involved in cell wall biosynthesis
MTPIVSVVMAAKNYACFLPAAVESVLAQTFTDWELVVIDDGSTDDTSAVIKPYLVDRRIRSVRSDRLGQSRAKNLGVGLGRGPFVAFLDADDVWKPTKLEQQLALFAAKPEVGVVFSLRDLIDEAGHPLPRTARDATLPPRGRVLTDIFARNFICFSSAVVRREVLDRVGGFDPTLDLAIDYDLWLRAARHYEFDYVPESLVLYRTGHGNLSKKLADRIATARSIMHRAIRRRSFEVPTQVAAEGFAAVTREMGYLLRGTNPAAAARWYLQALADPAGRLKTLKGLAGLAVGWLRGKQVPLAPENASENI